MSSDSSISQIWGFDGGSSIFGGKNFKMAGKPEKENSCQADRQLSEGRFQQNQWILHSFW